MFSLLNTAFTLYIPADLSCLTLKMDKKACISPRSSLFAKESIHGVQVSFLHLVKTQGADTQANLSLHWAYMSFVSFVVQKLQ